PGLGLPFRRYANNGRISRQHLDIFWQRWLVVDAIDMDPSSIFMIRYSVPIHAVVRAHKEREFSLKSHHLRCKSRKHDRYDLSIRWATTGGPTPVSRL